MKFAHFRPLVVVFVCLLLGMLLASFANAIGWWIILIVLAVGLVLVGLTMVPYKREGLRKFVSGAKKVAILGLAVILICQPIFFITKHFTQSSFQPTDNVYRINGVVNGTPTLGPNSLRFSMRELKFTYDFVETNVRENMFVVVFLTGIDDGNAIFNMDAGDKVTFNAKITATPVFDGADIDGFAYESGEHYSAKVHYTEIVFTDGPKNFLENIIDYIGDILRSAMGEKYGGLALAILFGERSGLDYDLNNNFKDTGVVHIIAVSGLNVAFITLLLMFVLRRTKLNMKWQTLIVSAVLFFYCFMCGFCPSITRATLMAVLILVGRCLGEQYDPLSSVSLAGILILLFSPLYAFNIGFLLSFASVFAIFWLTPIFTDWFKFMPKFLSSSLAVTLAATLGTIPLTLAFFGVFPTFTLLTNLVIVPLFGVIYCMLFVMVIVCVLFSWFFPAVEYILKLPEWGFWLVDKVTELVAGIPGAVLEVPFKLGLGAGCYYVGLFVSSRFCLVSKRAKLITAATLLAVFSVVLIVNQFWEVVAI